MVQEPSAPALQDTAIVAASASEESPLSWSLQGEIEFEPLELPSDYQALNSLLFDL